MTIRHYLRMAARMIGGLGLTVALLAAPTLAQAEDKPVIVFAAASLKNALDDASAAWKAKSGHSATASYAASSALAKQIEQGAPADLFFSADLDWMDYLDKRQLIKADSRASLLGNGLVLIAPADSKAQVSLTPGVDLAPLIGSSRIALCDLAVPAGKYGKAALEALGGWDSIKDKTAAAENVRAALSLVSRGEAPLGIVYTTDAVADKGVKVLATFPDKSHPPILYPVALTASATNPLAGDFLAFLKSPEARPFFEKQGFTVLAPAK